ncbi:BppU family phage baseplate upper protein [Polynucleobacter sp.]|uniref:BppU family phage baseplate upper protein n=1 Tax=Polynucleobacter sp. TaxID=2029855 RepID=UPI003F699235
MSSTITVIRRDDNTFTTTFSYSDGTPYNLTDCTVFFTVKLRDIDTDAQALITKTITSHSDPTNGVTQLDLSHTDTNFKPGTYKYDFQLKSSGGDIMSSSRGTFVLVQDITIRIS